jgi:hypothetical protein
MHKFQGVILGNDYEDKRDILYNFISRRDCNSEYYPKSES